MKIWSENEEKVLKDNYNRIPFIELKKILPNKTGQQISSKAQKLGVICNTKLNKGIYSSNISFFSDPNIQNSYWAGYIAADGCISKKWGILSLRCMEPDIEILENFKSHSESTNPIRIRNTKPMEIGDKIYQRYKTAELLIAGMYEWKDDLNKIWNVTPNKSLSLQPPNITDPLQKYAYIIGYFDGDGSMGSYIHRNRMRLNLKFTSGSKNILEWIRESVKTLCPTLSWNDKIYQRLNTYYIKWTNTKAEVVHSTLNSIVDIPWKLRRKWDIY